MLDVMAAARKAGIRVFYALHHRYRPGDFETWTYIAPIQRAAWSRKTFEYGTWGGEVRDEFQPESGDVVAQEHWCSSGFANTDLDLQLKKHGVHKLIVVRLIAHTCVEATVRWAALEINIPHYATAVVTTGELVQAIS
jgi:ureidoacrylate peracid hydrolase